MPNVSFTERMEELVQKQIKSGAYANVSEVVRAGLRMLMEKDQARFVQHRWAYLNELDDAVASIDKGATYVGDDVFAWMDKWGTKHEAPLAKAGFYNEQAKK